MEHLRRRYSPKLDDNALRFMRGTLAMDPRERLSWQGMLTHAYFEGMDGWDARRLCTKIPARRRDNAAKRRAKLKRRKSTSHPTERKHPSPTTSPMTLKERRERRMKENAGGATSTAMETTAARAAQSELEAAASEAKASRERRKSSARRAGDGRQGEGVGRGVGVLDVGGGEAAEGKVWRRRWSV